MLHKLCFVWFRLFWPIIALLYDTKLERHCIYGCKTPECCQCLGIGKWPSYLETTCDHHSIRKRSWLAGCLIHCVITLPYDNKKILNLMSSKSLLLNRKHLIEIWKKLWNFKIGKHQKISEFWFISMKNGAEFIVGSLNKTCPILPIVAVYYFNTSG